MRSATVGRGKSVPIPGWAPHHQEITLDRFSRKATHICRHRSRYTVGRACLFPIPRAYNLGILYPRASSYPCMGNSAWVISAAIWWWCTHIDRLLIDLAGVRS